jgi:predicted amidohydrolase YtcJ
MLHRTGSTRILFAAVSTLLGALPVAAARSRTRKPERLRLDSLVDGYTRNAAFQLGRSDQLGIIEVGKWADLVVLNRNLFEVDRYDIHQVRPVAVWLDGELVHGALQAGTSTSGDVVEN